MQVVAKAAQWKVTHTIQIRIHMKSFIEEREKGRGRRRGEREKEKKEERRCVLPCGKKERKEERRRRRGFSLEGASYKIRSGCWVGLQGMGLNANIS